jgi:hypothetical protein
MIIETAEERKARRSRKWIREYRRAWANIAAMPTLDEEGRSSLDTAKERNGRVIEKKPVKRKQAS